MQGSARKDVVCGAARVYIVVLPGPKWKSWLRVLHPTVSICGFYAIQCYIVILNEIQIASGASGLPSAIIVRAFSPVDFDGDGLCAGCGNGQQGRHKQQCKSSLHGFSSF